MKNINKKHNIKKEKLLKRQREVERTCIKLLNENVELTYANISQETFKNDKNTDSIPVKTLQNKNYKPIIDKYRKINEEKVSESKELNRAREEIKYLRKIIEKLNQENHNLKTELYYSGKI
jgi:hypothetical protein